MMPDAQAGLDPSVSSVVKDDVDALKRQVYNQDKRRCRVEDAGV